jgi:hypothetical protein
VYLRRIRGISVADRGLAGGTIVGVPVRRRFGVRATAPDAMARNLALLRAFRDLERGRVTVGAVAGVVVVALIGAFVAGARPGWIGTVVAFVGAVIAFAVVTFGVAAIGRPGQTRRALEAYRWVVREDGRRWTTATGEPQPSRPTRARTWLEHHPAAGGTADLPRIELLIWIGEFDAARRVVAGLPSETAKERFERALRRASVDFVATGDGDLAAARLALDDLPPAEQIEAGARLAVEAARQAASARGGSAATGTDYLAPLVRARDELGDAADGFLLPDLARWVVRPLLLLGAISALTSFLVAGALPPG